MGNATDPEKEHGQPARLRLRGGSRPPAPSAACGTPSGNRRVSRRLHGYVTAETWARGGQLRPGSSACTDGQAGPASPEANAQREEKTVSAKEARASPPRARGRRAHRHRAGGVWETTFHLGTCASRGVASGKFLHVSEFLSHPFAKRDLAEPGWQRPCSHGASGQNSCCWEQGA